MSVLRWGRRITGAALLIAAGTPVYRLLDSPETGLAGSFTVSFLELHLEFVWAGLFVLLPVALLGGLLMQSVVDRITGRAAAFLIHVRLLHLAIGLALFAGAVAAAFALLALDGKPNQIDSIAQMLHARFWSEGRLAGPISDGGGFWSIQNALFTDHGWVSQYPPGHVAVLALFLKLGAAWLAGPVLVAVTVFFATLLISELLPEQPATARLAALACAVSPFFLLVGGSFMNHISAAAGIMMGAYALARAWQGHAAWALLAGFAFAFALTVRPLSSLSMSAVIFLLVPFAVVAKPRVTQFGKYAALCTMGALPLLIALLVYNHHFFGSPTTFGYQVALGPNMRLGLHLDPWGNRYGLAEAVGYTAADLLTLGLNLFETPLSALFIIGAFLLFAKQLSATERLLLGWALAPVVSNFFYWHHGLFMGPRMLHEAAPAWAMLTAIAAVRVVGLVPRRLSEGRFNARSGVATAMVGAFAFGLLFLAPPRAASYGGGWLAITRMPTAAVAGPALVFVHDAWMARTRMTLASHGYRLDTVETLLRQNSTCTVQKLTDLVSAGDTANTRALLAQLDTVPRATRLPRTIEIAPGDLVVVVRGETLTADCMMQARSDTAGILDLAPFIWRGDLPGAEPRGALYVRDLGPARNATLIAQHPQRTPYVYVASGRTGVALYPYEEGMRRLWNH